MTLKPIAVAILVAGAVAGCSDSSSDSDDGPSYADYLNEFDALANEAATRTVTDPSSLPASGSAEYDGVIGLSLVDGDSNTPLLGDLELDVGFASGTVTGSADDFRTQTNSDVAGDLAITNGAIDFNSDPATDATFVADLDGTLTFSDDAYAIDSTLGGIFAGGTDYVEGAVVGEYTSGGETGGVAGAFVGRQDP